MFLVVSLVFFHPGAIYNVRATGARCNMQTRSFFCTVGMGTSEKGMESRTGLIVLQVDSKAGQFKELKMNSLLWTL